jgi:hypothetical protein
VADYTEVAEEDAQPPKGLSPRQTRADTLRAIANQSDEAEAPRRGRSRKELPGVPDLPDLAEEMSDVAHENVSETQGEQDEPESEDVGQDPIDEPEPAFDRKSKDYQRGAEDFAAGLKRCLNAEIRADVQRFENWKAGWLEAKEAAGPDAA